MGPPTIHPRGVSEIVAVSWAQNCDDEGTSRGIGLTWWLADRGGCRGVIVGPGILFWLC